MEPGFKVNLGAHFYAEVGNVPLPNAIRECKEDNLESKDFEGGVEKLTKTSSPKRSNSQKVFRNGQLYIIHGVNIYNAQGMRL